MDYLSEDDLREAIRYSLMSTDFQLLNYKFQCFIPETHGYMGNYYNISIEYMYGGKEHMLHLFSKCLSRDKTMRKYEKENEFFSKEAHFYNCLAPEMNNLLPSELPLPIPLCYLSRGPPLETCSEHNCSTDEESLIILEDLHARGYHLSNKWTPLDLPHCKLLLKALAVFHGGSFLMQKSQEILAESLENDFDEEDAVKFDLHLIKESQFMGDKNHIHYRILHATAKTTANVMKKLWPSQLKHVDHIRLVDSIWGNFQSVLSIVHPSAKYANVVCHGDLNFCNLLFTYDKDLNGVITPVDVKLVDLQFYRFAPPATDILFLLHVCTRREFREENLSELLTYYYKELGRVITPAVKETFMTKPKFEDSVKEMKIFGIMVAIHFIPLLLEKESDPANTTRSSSDKTSDILENWSTDRSDLIWEQIQKNSEVKERIEEIYKEYLEFINLWFEK